MTLGVANSEGQTWEVLMSAMVMPVYEFHILFSQVYSELASGRYYLDRNSKKLYLLFPFFTVHGHEYIKRGESQVYLAVTVSHLHEDGPGSNVHPCCIVVSLYILLNCGIEYWGVRL